MAQLIHFAPIRKIKKAPELRKAGALLTYEKHHFPV
jgi:hypothetical protein